MTESNRLVLLFGMPRSGTTWLGKIFDSHPSVHYFHEPDSEWPLKQVPLILESPYSEETLQTIQAFLLQLGKRSALRVNGKLPVFKKKGSNGLVTQLHHLNILAAKAANGLNLKVPLFSAGSAARKSEFWVWKSIESVGRMAATLEASPEARGVLLIRHPCGHAASVISGQSKNIFSSGRNIEEDFGILEILAGTSLARNLGLSLEKLKNQSPVQRIAWRWRIFNEIAIQQLSQQSRNRILIYEDLCADPIGVTKSLYEDIGLPWNPQTEDFVTASVQSEESSFYGVFKDPLKSANKWRTTLDASVIEQVMEIVEDSPVGQLFQTKA